MVILSLLLLTCGRHADGDERNLPVPQEAGVDAAFDFEKDSAGTLPGGWYEMSGRWSVTQDERGKVMMQSGESRLDLFNICLAGDYKYHDIEFEARVRAEKGTQDQGGGLIWRAKDARNYYLARVNPLESNFRLYKVVDGYRELIESSDVKCSTGRWFTVKIVASGSRVTCIFNDRELMSLEDKTFLDAGLVGLWTKSDAVTSFDDLMIKVLK